MDEAQARSMTARFGRWLVIKPQGFGGPGIRFRRFGPIVLWQSWPHENAGLSSYWVRKGWAWTFKDAIRLALAAQGDTGG